MTISREAVEAACEAVLRQRKGTHPRLEWPPLTLEERWEVQAALTAALPHLAPKPSQSDEERSEEIARAFTPVDMGGTVKSRTERILAFAAVVRAEEREATKRDLVSKTQEFVRDAIASQLDAKNAEIAALREALAEFMAQQPFDGDRDQLAARRAARAALEMSGGVK